MKYRVVFRERPSHKGIAAENPIDFLQKDASQGIVRNSTFVLRKDPEVHASTDPVEEDEELSGLGTEIWEYEVAEGRDQEFKDALLNSGSIVEFTPVGIGERI
ncbi:MAG: hypothetical protein ACJ746_14280 [Bryobacteraceae bacterium]